MSTDRLAASGCFDGYKVIDVAEGEEAAANTIRFNDLVLMPAGFPRTPSAIASRGLHGARNRQQRMRQARRRHVLPVACASPQAMTCAHRRLHPSGTADRQGSVRRRNGPRTMARRAAALQHPRRRPSGRLQYEAVFSPPRCASDPDFPGTLFIAEPQPGPKWRDDPRITARATRALLDRPRREDPAVRGRDFGADYPHGNKIEALAALPDAPFLFLDTDTLITGSFADVPFDFAHPSASMRREGTWPQIELYGPGYAATWKSLYDRFGLDFASSLDLSQPDDYWQRYLYFNAGWFFHASPRAFGERFRDYRRGRSATIRPSELVCQELDPWLDQIALPLVIHSFGGGRPGPDLAGLDGAVTCHYRTLPLLYARESDRAVEVLESVAAPNPVKKVLREYEPFKRMVYQGERGTRCGRCSTARTCRAREQVIRNTIKRAGLWMR